MMERSGVEQHNYWMILAHHRYIGISVSVV